MKPVPDFHTATHICFRQITKGPQERALIGKHYKGQAPAGKTPGWQAGEIAQNKVPCANGAWPGQKHTELSIEAEAQETLYLIGLDNSTRTRFGPNRYPIQLFPAEYTDAFLKDVGLIYLDKQGQPSFVEAKDIAANYGNIPTDAILAFTLQRTALESAWNAGVVQAGHGDFTFAVPFYLDLYDISTGRPVWTFGAGHGPSKAAATTPTAKAAPGSGTLQPLIHGGIHPSSVSQVFY